MRSNYQLREVRPADLRRLRWCSLRSQPGLRLRALSLGWVRLRWCSRKKEQEVMALQVAELSIELIETLRPLMPRIRARDKGLEDQIRRAASSIALNMGEAEYSDAGNRRARLFTAAGSAGETLIALRVAMGWEIVERREGEAAVRLLRRVEGVNVTRGRGHRR
jgi:four helix bundle protein